MLIILGWTNRTCPGGVDIFRKNETYLISLMGDTKEKCQALCDALPECSLAKFHSEGYRDIYKCIPKANFEGGCRDRYYYRRTKFYVKKKADNKTRCYSDTSEQTLKSIQSCLNISMGYIPTHVPRTQHQLDNVTKTWTWKALENGMTNDCRLCVPTRSKEVWNSCKNYCKDIPNELKDMEIIMALTQNPGGDSWLRSSKYGREQILKILKSSPALLKLYTNDIPKFQNRMLGSMNT